MIQQDQHIIFISQAKCAVTTKQTESIRSGMLEKKIVATTRRCLFFESLSNQVSEIEFEVLTKKKKAEEESKKEKQIKKRISINEVPQHSFSIGQRECKIMIDNEPSCIMYLEKIGLRNLIKSITGIVILKNTSKMKFELLAFPSLKDGFRFCKALICAKAWMDYETYCHDKKIPINKMWMRIVSQITNSQKSVTLIDPQLFQTGSADEIKAFMYLINQIPFAHSFEHRYLITNNQISGYASQFIEIFQQKTHSLIFRHNTMNAMFLNAVFIPRIKLEHIMHLDLSHNKLTDEAFAVFQRLSKEGKKLSYFNLSHNCIDFHNVTLFINFLKTTQVMLTVDLSHNQIDDNCLESIEKFIVMAQQPPIDEINFSFNKLSKKIIWRLFVGNLKHQQYHPTMNFIIYPIPIKSDTFPVQDFIDYPKPQPLINFNIHSALVEEFEQESFMRHTFNQMLLPQGTIIKLVRNLPKDVKLPRSKQQVHKTLQLANKIENFIYSPQFVENMHDLAEQIGKFEFNLSPVTKSHYIKYLSDKLNEALVIRDHYSVKYILMALKVLQVDLSGYESRIEIVHKRNQLFAKKIEEIYNFEIDEVDINYVLDQMVREGLRLYLTGNGIETTYYLKFLRDKWVERLIQEKNNPQHFIYQKMADKNMNFDDEIIETQLLVPYQIRVEKKINENFYLHPWKANYLILSQILSVEYQECLKFLQKSSKREKFAQYFQRIQQRIEFMKNQFNFFSYGKFRCSYSDLKINCARLLAMYQFIQDKNYYLDIPAYTRKLPINKQKTITIQNENRFKIEYQIGNYPNINKKARSGNFFNYNNKMTKYSSEVFRQQYVQLKIKMDPLFKVLQHLASTNTKQIPQYTIDILIKIIKHIREAVYPVQLKEEFYLRLLSWRGGKHMNNKEILQFMPFLSMYLRPPLPLEKYIIAAILNNQSLNLGEMPLSIVSDVSKASDVNLLLEMQRNYVERDWMGTSKILIQLMKNNGKVEIDVQLLTKIKKTIPISESSTVRQLAQILLNTIKQTEDSTHYWLYMGYVGQNQLTVLQECQHIGQILAEKEDKQRYFVFKRRIYCPEWKYIYQKYSQIMIESLYYDVKTQYLLGQFFINDPEMINLAAEMYIIDSLQQQPSKTNFKQFMNNKIKNLGNEYRGYMPAQAIQRSMKPYSELVSEMRQKIMEKLYKKEHLKPLEIKKQILHRFEDYPQFMCSNYVFLDRNKKDIKISINWLHIIVNSQTQVEKFGLERIISIIPMTKFLLINYHKHEGIVGKVNLFADENKILSTALDILTYCLMRVKMNSPSLYAAYRYEYLVQNYIKVKQPTNDQEKLDIVRRIKKKLAVATPTILESSIIPYFNTNKYIKMYKQRKLFANASLEKLDINDDDFDDFVEVEETGKKGKIKLMDDSEDVSKHNVFRTIYPNINDQNKEKNEKNQMKSQQDNDQSLRDQIPSNLMKSYSQPSNVLAYNQINASYQGEDIPSPSQPPPSQPQAATKTILSPPLLPIIEQIKQLQKDDKEDEPPPQMTPIKQPAPTVVGEEFEHITNAQRTRPRGPPRRNR